MRMIKPVLPLLALLSAVHGGAAFGHERKLSSAKAFKDGGKASKKGEMGESSAKASKQHGGETGDAKAQKVSKASKSKATKLFKSKSAKSGSETPPADEAHSGGSDCGDGIVQDPEECDDGNTEDGDGCSPGCTVEQSCDIQLFNLQYPTEERIAANDQYYSEDFKSYSADPLAFLEKGVKECGNGGANFASLGKLIIGEYSDIARYMQAPQVRGFFIGRGRTIPERLPPNFMLSLDDPGTGTEQGESGIHEILHDFAWYDTIGKAQARIDSDENTKTTLESFITRLISEVSDAGDDAAAVKSAAEQFIGRYMMKAIFDLDYADEQVATLQMLWQSRQLAVGGLFEGNIPDNDWVGIKQLLDSTSADIAASPALADYESSEVNFNLSREEWANELMYVAGIAALGGSRNLVNNLFSKMPSDYEIDATNHEEVANAVLEAGRIKAPVNNVNIILQEPTDFEIGGEAKTFPAGTVVALSIGLGSMDEKVFPDPHTFDHTRNNLLSNVLTYNSVGFETGGPRVCPGKNIAFNMAMDVLKAWLQKE